MKNGEKEADNKGMTPTSTKDPDKSEWPDHDGQNNSHDRDAEGSTEGSTEGSNKKAQKTQKLRLHSTAGSVFLQEMKGHKILYVMYTIMYMQYFYPFIRVFANFAFLLRQVKYSLDLCPVQIYP